MGSFMSSPKNIIITGASNGIGAALAKKYAGVGITLGLIARNSERLQAIADDCIQQGAQVHLGLLDVSESEIIAKWLLDFDDAHPVDLVIANAGITNSIQADNVETWAGTCQILDINLYGVINTVYPLIRPMQQRQQGQIACMSSLAAYRGMPVTPSYCASKAAVKAYTEALRGALAPDKIKVSVICSGFVKSNLSAAFPGPKLFMLTPEKAAKLISAGLAKNKACISFPFPLNIGMQLLALLPDRPATWILSQLKYGANKR